MAHFPFEGTFSYQPFSSSCVFSVTIYFSLCPMCPSSSAQPSIAAALWGAVLTSTSADSEGDAVPLLGYHQAQVNQSEKLVSRCLTLPAYEHIVTRGRSLNLKRLTDVIQNKTPASALSINLHVKSRWWIARGTFRVHWIHVFEWMEWEWPEWPPIKLIKSVTSL